MKTLYAACLARLGLSQSEAAVLHDARLDTIKNWSVGRRGVPDGAWADLRAYEARIVDQSEAIREAHEDAGADLAAVAIDVHVASDVGLMALADFVLSSDGAIPEVG